MPSSDQTPAETEHKLPPHTGLIHSAGPSAIPLSRTAAALDAADPLRSFRHQFHLPPDTVYLCGNSLGPQPIRTQAALNLHLAKWRTQAVAAHFHHPQPWLSIDDRPATLLAPVVGAKHPHEVAVMNSLTVNIHLLLTAFYRPSGVRCKVLIEQHAFSSDDYALQTHLTSRGIDPQQNIVRLAPREGEYTLRTDDILQQIHTLAAKGQLALVFLPGVQFYTGQVLPLAAIANACTVAKIPFGTDLAHAVGNIPLRLHNWGVDFAAWCHYKYLNAGPGAVAGAFIHHKHAGVPLRRLGGWWGVCREVRFRGGGDVEFEGEKGVRGFRVSNPPVFGVVPVAEGLTVLGEAGGIEAVREKSVKMGGFLEECLRTVVGERSGNEGGVEVLTPRAVEERGCQLSLRICGAVGEKGGKGEGGVVREVNERLERLGVVCDVREPDVIRVAPAPLFNSFEEVLVFACALRQALVDVGVLCRDGGKVGEGRRRVEADASIGMSLLQ